MRVLMLNNEFPPLGGGTGTVNEALFRHFASVPDLHIDLITSALAKTREEHAFAGRIRIIKVPVDNRNIHHSSNRELLSYAVRALPCAARLHQEAPYDFCFAWCSMPAGAVALALRSFYGLPYLVRVSGPDIPGFERRYGPLYPVLTPIIKRTWTAARVVVAKCAGEAEMIHAVQRDVRVELIPNGVDLSRFGPARAIPDDGPLKLICVGRLIERKGQHHLIEAVRQLVESGIDLQLELVGIGDALASYAALVQEFGLGERVHFAGYVPREEIPLCYTAAHVFVLPSYNEGMSVATLEAMASGLPVICSRTGGTAELIEEGVNGLTFAWEDVAGMANHIRALALNRELAREMGAASRSRAKRFTWDAAASSYLDLFERIRQF